MDFDTISALVDERQAALRRAGERARSGRAARAARRRLPRRRDRSPTERS